MADESSADGYIFDRSYMDNTRLNLQHHLWVTMFGYLLHPDIPRSKENLRIADIGTGTGIWLSDLSRQISPTSQLDGFDISLVQAKPHAWLPANVTLRQWDALSDVVPTELIGQYDIVHIRLFAYVLQDHNPKSLLRNLMLLLKPGGWLQWGEPDVETAHVRTSSSSNSSAALEQMSQVIKAKGMATDPEFVKDLPAIFEEAGLEGVKTHVCRASDRDSFAMHECSLVAVEMLLGPENAKLHSEVVKETREGAMFALERVTVIGAKKGGGGGGVSLRDYEGSRMLD